MTPKLITAFETKFVFETIWRKYHVYVKRFKKKQDKVSFKSMHFSSMYIAATKENPHGN